MDEPNDSKSVCQEISGELRGMATWLSTGQLSPEQFRLAVLALEAAKVKRFGFRLTGENRPNGRTHFELRFLDDDQLCSTLDFDSRSRELTIDHVCG